MTKERKMHVPDSINRPITAVSSIPFAEKQGEQVEQTVSSEVINPVSVNETSSPSSPLVQDWFERGSYHFQRKEYELSIDAFQNALREVGDKDNLPKMIQILKELGRTYLQKSEWVTATKQFNRALALNEKSTAKEKEITKQALFGLMVEAERNFLVKECKIEKPNCTHVYYTTNREKLQEVRRTINVQMESKQPLSVVLEKIHKEIGYFVEEMLQVGEAYFNRPPCDYTILALNEVGLYSPLSILLLTSKSSPEVSEYFRKLLLWFEIQMINLGETDLISRGFSLDLGSKASSTSSPTELVKCHLNCLENQDPHLANQLRHAKLLYGEKGLREIFVKEIKKQLKSPSSEKKITQGQKQALLNIAKGLFALNYKVDRFEKKSKTFNIDKELYRFFNSCIEGLADYFEVEGSSPFAMIDALIKKNVFCSEGGQNLKATFEAIVRLRFCCYQHYRKGCTDTFPLEAEGEGDGTFVLDQSAKEQVIEIYRVLFPLAQKLDTALKANNFKMLSKEKFYDTSLIAQGRAYEKLLDPLEAKKCYRQLLAFDQSDNETRLAIVEALISVGEISEAKKYLEFLMPSQKEKPDPLFMLKALRSFAIIYYDDGDYKAVIQAFQKVLQIFKDLKIADLDTATILNELGAVYRDVQNYEKAIPCFEKALGIFTDYFGKTDPYISRTLNNMGLVLASSGDSTKAMRYCRQALSISKKLFGEDHVDIATSHLNIGNAHSAGKNYSAAIVSYKAAYDIFHKILGETNSHTADCLENIGIATKRIGNLEEAMSFYDRALKIKRQVHGNLHLDVGNCLFNMGALWIASKNFDKAANYLEDALKIYEAVYPFGHPQLLKTLTVLVDISSGSEEKEKLSALLQKALRLLKDDEADLTLIPALQSLARLSHRLDDVVTSIAFQEAAVRIFKGEKGEEEQEYIDLLINLGAFYGQGSNFEKALKTCEKALVLCTQLQGVINEDAVGILKNMGLTCRTAGDKRKALEYNEKALEMKKQLGEDDIGGELIIIGKLMLSIGENEKALSTFKEALKIHEETLGEEDSQIVSDLIYIGRAWKALGRSGAAERYFNRALKLYQEHFEGADLYVRGLKTLFPEKIEQSHTASEIAERLEEANMVVPLPYQQSNSSPSQWKLAGDQHLEKKELDKAIDAYSNALKEAEEKNKTIEITHCLIDIGRVFLEKRQWTLAAKILNGALANSPGQKEALALLSELERRFLEYELKVRKETIESSFTFSMNHRERLKLLRDGVVEDVKACLPAEAILKKFSQAINGFIRGLVESFYPLLGTPPCDFALLNLGSLAREEMSPFSDLEFAILIPPKSKSETLDYFRKLTKWLELKVINLGETEIKILEGGRKSPVAAGFAFDSGGNTPLGKEELIKTPDQMAQFQHPRFYDEDLILSNTLRTAGLIMGSKSLFVEYGNLVKKIVKGPSKKEDLSIQQSRALHILQGHLVQFAPQLNREKEVLPIFNIKEELYRLPNFLIAGLAEFFGIDKRNSWEKLDVLAKKNVLHPEAVKNLKTALNAVMTLRIRAHLHYQRECDEACHPLLNPKEMQAGNDPFVLSADDMGALIDIYRVISPFHKGIQQFCRTQNLKELANQTFYDDPLFAKASVNEKLFQFEEARKLYQEGAALHPLYANAQLKMAEINLRLVDFARAKECAEKAFSIARAQEDDEQMTLALNILGLICNKQGDHQKAIEHLTMVEEWIRKQFGEDHPHRISSLNNLGLAYADAGQFGKAVELLDEALRICKVAYHANHPSVATVLSSCSTAKISCGHYKEALKCSEEALRIDFANFGEWHPSIAVRLGVLCVISKELGSMQKAVDYGTRALDIDRKFYSEDHPKIGTRLSNLGTAYQYSDDLDKAILYFEKALSISSKVYDEDHSIVVADLNNLGLAWLDKGDPAKALDFLNQAFERTEKKHGKEHPSQVTHLVNMALAWKKSGKAKEAQECFKQALELGIGVFGEKHPHVIQIYHGLGELMQECNITKQAMVCFQKALELEEQVNGEESLGIAKNLLPLGQIFQQQLNLKPAMGCYQQALGIYRKALGNDHKKVGESLNNIGTLYNLIGDQEQALAYLEEALQIIKKQFGKDHPSVGGLLGNIGSITKDSGDPQKALKYFEEALSIVKKTHGDDSPDVAIYLNNIGQAYCDLGDLQKAIANFEAALSINVKNYGRIHPKVAVRLSNMSHALYLSGNITKAFDCLKEAVEIDQQVFGEDDIRTAARMNSLGELFEATDNVVEAIKYYEKALKIVIAEQGKSNPLAQSLIDKLKDLDPTFKLSIPAPLVLDPMQAMLMSLLGGGRIPPELADILSFNDEM